MPGKIGTGDLDAVGASEGTQYSAAFYFALVTVTTVGYGDILPETDGEKKFVVIAILLGAFLYAYIIGDFSNMLGNISKERNDYVGWHPASVSPLSVMCWLTLEMLSLQDQHMRTVNELLTHVHAKPVLRTKVLDYYEFKYRECALNHRERASQ